MATNTQLKFYKGANAPAVPAAGMIWFNTTNRTIQVYNGTEWEKYAGLVDATWDTSERTLVLTSANGQTIEIKNLADSGLVSAALGELEGKINNAQAAADAAQADADALEKALGDGFSESSTATAQLAAVKATADAAAVKSDVDAALALKADASQVSADIATAKQEAIDTAAADAASKANAAESNAKSYADGLNNAMDGRVEVLEEAIGSNGSVDQAIAAAVNALDATVGSQTVAEGKHVAVEVVEVDGVLTGLTVVESDIASAAALAAEADTARAAEEALANRMDTAEEEIDALQEAVNILNAATHFEGVVDFDPSSEDATTEGYDAGDIVIYGNKEYIFDSAKWIELGDTTAEGQRIETLESWKSTASQSIADNAANIASNDEEILELQNRAKAIEDNITNNIATKQELADAQTAINANVNANANAITALQGVDDAFEDRIKANEEGIAAINEELESMATSETVADLASRVGATEDAIATLQVEQTTQNEAISAADAKGAQGISDAANALAVANTKVASVVAGDYITIGGTDTTEPTVSAITGTISEGANGLAKASDVYDALCWVEFN